ncbi:zinc-ribbon domain-containing protein [Cryobacterium sp. SO2]|uniref:zinc-ribbon domain-containing protein n=1 Tax=Cryobacterium sp. SO2 TaxID=1897060 RepID=UPI00223D518C|nr:zinc-ribbon domain-containing protein [Cryobacterium sp. SO2]WEO77051.1 zinc-ribbon domain-containing protein [Cryobacterium sp. SO2]
MILLFGTRASEAVINLVLFVCGYCGVLAQQQVIKRATRFTLFFLPLFPVSTRYVNVCSRCQGSTEVTAAQARHSLDWAKAQSAP